MEEYAAEKEQTKHAAAEARAAKQRAAEANVARDMSLLLKALGEYATLETGLGIIKLSKMATE